jgi:hypothetical protein
MGKNLERTLIAIRQIVYIVTLIDFPSGQQPFHSAEDNPDMTRFLWAALLFVTLTGLLVAPSRSQSKDKDKKKPEPRVLMTLPLGAAPGKTVHLIIRGQNLDKATELRFSNTKIMTKILSKGKAPTPEKSPEREGDTQVTADVVLPANLPGTAVAFIVVTTEGESKPHALLIEDKLPVIPEKEPNDGFRSAQRIKMPTLIDGTIDRPQDVDVFAFEGRVGQKLSVEVIAGKQGSLLDPVLTLYDEHGQQLAYEEGRSGSVDVRLDIVLPRAGTYFLSLMDAHDRGGVTFPYRLAIRSP